MYRYCVKAVVGLLAISFISMADDVLIESFDSSGNLSFTEISNAVDYRIEWMLSDAASWTNFPGEYGRWLNAIPASGETGTVTVSVPVMYRVVARIPPANMVYIPSGTFIMGNATNVFDAEEGLAEEMPQHEVFTDAIYMDRFEVSELLFEEVKSQSHTQGFYFTVSMPSTLTNKPIHELTWQDCIAWCNARSILEELVPVYYTDQSITNIYRGGVDHPYIKHDASGYRLPTEAEWEKAARGGAANTRFSWVDYTNRVSHEKANYYALIGDYNLSNGNHPLYGYDRAPIDSFTANPYGLHNMSGNVGELCWDWYDVNYYASSPVNNPLGASTGIAKVVRGGSFHGQANMLRNSFRDAIPVNAPVSLYWGVGFRTVRNAE
jgi:formylglycine-generating enzyme required for sulfatase activity